jgi:hypothetical protein
MARRAKLRCQGLLGLIRDGRKSGRVVESQLGQSPAVDFDTSLFQAVHEFRVAQAVGTGASIDPLDPQTPELALFNAAVPESKIAGPEQSLLDGPKQTVASTPEAFGAPHQAAAAAYPRDDVTCASHFSSSLMITNAGGSALSPHSLPVVRRNFALYQARSTQFAPPLGAFCGKEVARGLMPALDFAVFGQFDPAGD